MKESAIDGLLATPDEKTAPLIVKCGLDPFMEALKHKGTKSDDRPDFIVSLGNLAKALYGMAAFKDGSGNEMKMHSEAMG